MSLSTSDSSAVESMGSFEDWQWLALDSGANSDPASAQPVAQWPTNEAESMTPFANVSVPVHHKVEAHGSTVPVNLPVHQNEHPGFHGHRQPPHPHQGHWPHSYPTVQVGGSIYRVPPHGWYQHPGYSHPVQHLPGCATVPPNTRAWTGPALPHQDLRQIIQTPSNKQVPHQSSGTGNSNVNVTKTALNGVKKQKRKRKRTAFTTDQILALEKVFVTQPYIERKDRQLLGQKLNIDDRALKVWFQNRRMKGKRLKAEMEEELEEAMNSASPDSDYNSSESIISSSSNELDYVESQIRKSDENGLVTLDNKALETLFNVIGAHVPASAAFTLTISDENAAVKEDNPESPKSTVLASELPTNENVIMKYEPISPVESSAIEQDNFANTKEYVIEHEQIVLKEPSDEDKKTLFKLHFC